MFILFLVETVGTLFTVLFGLGSYRCCLMESGKTTFSASFKLSLVGFWSDEYCRLTNNVN